MEQSYEVILKTLEEQLKEHNRQMMYLETTFSISNDKKICTITLKRENNEQLKNRYQSTVAYDKQKVEEFLNLFIFVPCMEPWKQQVDRLIRITVEPSTIKWSSAIIMFCIWKMLNTTW